MLRASPMKKVQTLVLEKDVRAVTLELGSLRVLQITGSRETEGLELGAEGRAEEELAHCEALLSRARKTASAIGGALVRADVTDHLPLDEIEGVLERIEPRLVRISEKTTKLAEEISEKRRLAGEVQRYERLEIPFEDLQRTSFLHFAIGSIPSGQFDAVTKEAAPRAILTPFDEQGGRRHIIAVSSRKGKWALTGTLEKHDFQPESLGEENKEAPAAVVKRALAELEALDAKMREAESEREALRRELGPSVAAILGRLELERKILLAQKDFVRTRSTVLITGWAPAERVWELIETVLATTSNRAVIEVVDPTEVPGEEAPTKLSHHWFFRSFEMLVTAFGVPGYREAEPTVLVAVTFLLIFGFMFGDVGQGAVLFVAGLALSRLGKAPRTREIGVIVASAGAAAAVFGALYGSVFGYEHVIPALWMKPLAKVMEEPAALYTFFGATILIGFVMINIGLALNIVNRLRRRDWTHAFFDKFGVAGIVFYWGMMALGMRMIATGGVSLWAIIVFVVLPLAVIMCQEPIRMILSGATPGRRPEETGPVLALVFGAVEAFETILGYLSNTLSFVRVAAFALSHAALCLAVFALAEAIEPAGAGASAGRIAILVVGNVFIILLEGLIAAIQTMRLQYYEFFSKFFRGEGKPFEPFTLNALSHGNGSSMERSTPR